MIASITGTIQAKGDRFLILETGGIGYQVYTSGAVLADAKTGVTVTYYTYHHISETADELYGFPELAAVTFFELLLSISQVGPKTALNVMSVASLDELRTAILHGDPSLLTKVSGVGRKTAERIVLELKEKIDVLAGGDASVLKDDAAVLDALVSLGYSRADARTALRKVPKNVVGVSERVRETLRLMGGHGDSGVE